MICEEKDCSNFAGRTHMALAAVPQKVFHTTKFVHIGTNILVRARRECRGK